MQRGSEEKVNMMFYFIRHGQTDWNLAHRVQGMKDIPLNETGRQQAEKLAEGMKNRPVDRVYTSPLLRAKETAQYLAVSQQIPFYEVKGLEEISYGKWEGMTMKQIQFRYPISYKKWWKDPFNGAPPGGESQMDVIKRTARAMEAIKQHILSSDQAKAAAIVSHGASIFCLLQWLLRDEGGTEQEMSIGNTSITTLEWDSDKDQFRLLGLNDVRHLEENH